jgi:RNA polymerase sigma-70 factor (ECF subfamily)
MSNLQVDSELLTLVAAGDREAFRRLVDLSDRLVTSLIIDRVGPREEVQDLRQEVFFRVYKGLESLRDRKKFKSWLRGICRNVVREFWTARSRHHAALAETYDPEAPPEEDAEAVTIEFVVSKGLQTLPDRYKEVLRLRYFARMNYDDIASTLGLTYMAVDGLIRRAKARLKETMTPLLEREGLR